MAREFAKKFYHSKEWLKVREFVIQRDNGLCQECLKHGDVVPGEEVHHIEWLKPSNINNTDITLNPENLVYICKDCHFKIHKKERHKLNRQLPVVTNGTYFDDKGQLQKTMVYIVYGCPGAGKTTFVSENREYGDMIVDLDLIKQAISMDGKTETPDNLLNIALGIKEYLYALIADKEIDSRNIWIVASLPRKKERMNLKERLNAKLIFIDTDIDECISRVINDHLRDDKKKQIDLINKWFGCYEK